MIPIMEVSYSSRWIAGELSTRWTDPGRRHRTSVHDESGGVPVIRQSQQPVAARVRVGCVGQERPGDGPKRRVRAGVSNSLRCQRSTRASTSTMSHQLAVSVRGCRRPPRGWPCRHRSRASPCTVRPARAAPRRRRGAVVGEQRRFMRVADEPERAHRAVGQDRSGRCLGEEPEQGVARSAVPAVDAVTAGLGATRQPEHVASADGDPVRSERPEASWFPAIRRSS